MTDKQRYAILTYDRVGRIARDLPELDVFELMQLEAGEAIDLSTTDEEV